MQKIKKFWPFWIFPSFLILGVSLMTLVYLIPGQPIQESVQKSFDMYEEQGEYPRFLSWDFSTRKDNFTDMLMLDKAMYSDPERPFETSLLVPNEEFSSDNDTINMLKQVSLGKQGDKPESTYARYWHGYLVILKPLLLLFSPEQIYLLNLVILTILISLITYQISKKANIGYGIAFLLSMLFMNPVMLAGNFQFMTCTLVCLAISEWIIVRWDTISENNSFGKVFFISGILTSFFDLLTFPLITLGIPLLLSLTLMNEQEKTKETGKYFKYVIYQSMWWILGYSLMWSSKWILASLFTDQNVIADAVNSIGIRTGGHNQGGNIILTHLEGLIKNLFDSIINSSLVFCIILVLILLAFMRLKSDNSRTKVSLPSRISITPFGYTCLFVSCYPLIWTIILNNHSAIHHWFTFRIFSICFLGVSLGIINSVLPNRTNRY